MASFYRVPSLFCRSARPLATNMYSGKTVEVIKLPIGVVDGVDPRNHVIRWLCTLASSGKCGLTTVRSAVSAWPVTSGGDAASSQITLGSGLTSFTWSLIESTQNSFSDNLNLRTYCPSSRQNRMISVDPL